MDFWKSNSWGSRVLSRCPTMPFALKLRLPMKNNSFIWDTNINKDVKKTFQIASYNWNWMAKERIILKTKNKSTLYRIAIRISFLGSSGYQSVFIFIFFVGSNVNLLLLFCSFPLATFPQPVLLIWCWRFSSCFSRNGISPPFTFRPV